MRPRQAVLLTPSISLRPVFSPSCKQIAHERAQIPFFVFKRLRTLSFSVSRKSCVCHSCENCRVCANNSHSGNSHHPIRAISFLLIFLRTLLHSPKTQPLCFQAFPHSLPKTTRGGGTPSAQLSARRPLPNGLFCPIIGRRNGSLLSLPGFFNGCHNDFAHAFAQRRHILFCQTLGLDGVMQMNGNLRRPQHPMARPVMLKGAHQTHRHDRNAELLRHAKAAVLKLTHLPVAR